MSFSGEGWSTFCFLITDVKKENNLRYSPCNLLGCTVSLRTDNKNCSLLMFCAAACSSVILLLLL